MATLTLTGGVLRTMALETDLLVAWTRPACWTEDIDIYHAFAEEADGH
jgi:hypothetical protein